MKKKAKEETTSIPKIYHEALQEVAKSESPEAKKKNLDEMGYVHFLLHEMG